MINKRLDIFKKSVRIERRVDVFGDVHLTAEYKGHCLSVVLPYSQANQESEMRYLLKQALAKKCA